MAVTRESGDLPSICNSHGPGGVAKEAHMNTQTEQSTPISVASPIIVSRR